MFVLRLRRSGFLIMACCPVTTCPYLRLSGVQSVLECRLLKSVTRSKTVGSEMLSYPLLTCPCFSTDLALVLISRNVFCSAPGFGLSLANRFSLAADCKFRTCACLLSPVISRDSTCRLLRACCRSRLVPFRFFLQRFSAAGPVFFMRPSSTRL